MLGVRDDDPRSELTASLLQTMEDVKIKTRTGGFLTLASLFLILSLTLYEFVDYRRVHWNPSLVVDKSRGEKLVVNLNVTFPRVPCYREPMLALSRLACALALTLAAVLSVDIMDISGEHQNGSSPSTSAHLFEFANL